MRAIAVIPARGGSKRLPRKNVLPVLGKPLLAWTVEAALGSRFLGPGSVYVSTEDAEIAAAARTAGAEVIDRPEALAADHVWTEPVIRHAVEMVEATGSGDGSVGGAGAGAPIELVAWMNACVPELTSADIDRAFQRVLEEGLREVISVDAEGRSHSAVRVVRRDVLFQDRLSVVFAAMPLDYMDVHTAEELEAVERRLRERSE